MKKEGGTDTQSVDFACFNCSTMALLGVCVCVFESMHGCLSALGELYNRYIHLLNKNFSSHHSSAIS